MANHCFFTGFPGFIGKRLVSRLASKDPQMSFAFLVQEKMRDAALFALGELEAEHSGIRDRSTVLVGDITQSLLGLEPSSYAAETARTTHVWHLAAIYDLSVPEAIAYQVNVVGTANVLDFCESSPNLVRLDYVSTCYVSGKRTGLVLESELDEGQAFKNHYEATKCWAEIEVRRRQHRIPTCIHRPAIVIGDSRTGETDKYDGPYFFITLLARLPGWMPVPNVGDGTSRLNLVCVDFLVDAMAELGFKEEALGETVQLADPSPYTTDEIVGGVLEILGRRRPRGRVPAKLVIRALGVDGLRNMVKVPSEAVTYFDHVVEYDTSQQRRLLAGTNVRCPDLMSVLPTLVDYVLEHPDKAFADGRTF
jgi:thioester reductase-like protein